MTTRIGIALSLFILSSFLLSLDIPTVQAGDPCCGVVAIAKDGLVTAKEAATGKSFQFTVSNPALLKTLRVGQKIHADFGTQQVSVDGIEPCCNIISAVKMPDVHGVEPCCSIAANPAMKGRLGRLVIAYPVGSKTNGTNLTVYKAGNATPIADSYGNQALDLLPGSYEVVISGQRVTGVTIQSGHDTTVKVGLLRITAGKNTEVSLIDPKSGKSLTSGYGNQEYGLPIGTVNVMIAGQAETVTITEGAITDF